MKMRKLSEMSGLPVATIKFYLREGLLHEGVKQGPNQATYDQSHVRRLGLIRALTAVGGLSVAATRGVLNAIDSDRSLPEVFAVAQHSVSLQVGEVDDKHRETVDRLLGGMTCGSTNPGRLVAADVLASFEEAGVSPSPVWLEKYLAAALIVAEADLEEVAAQGDREAKAEMVVVGTILGDRLLAALRRVAQEHATSLRSEG